jgi:signal peptidase
MNLKLKKTVKVLRIAASAVWWCVLLLLFALLVNIFGSKMAGRVPSVFGYSVINIVSGSMEDEIPRGSYILIKKTDAEKIKKDDVICFYSTDPKIYGILNTHRVAEEPIITEQGIEFITKGDANSINDTETAKGDRVVGVYVKRLDGITALSHSLKQKNFAIVIICLLVPIIVMFVLSSVLLQKNSKNTSQEEHKE